MAEQLGVSDTPKPKTRWAGLDWFDVAGVFAAIYLLELLLILTRLTTHKNVLLVASALAVVGVPLARRLVRPGVPAWRWPQRVGVFRQLVSTLVALAGGLPAFSIAFVFLVDPALEGAVSLRPMFLLGTGPHTPQLSEQLAYWAGYMGQGSIGVGLLVVAGFVRRPPVE